MSFILSSNMNLPVPVVGQEQGPNYATDVNNSLTLIDSHDHSPGKGVQITPAGLNINAALSLQSNFLTNTAGVILTPQISTPPLNTIYESGVDLFFVDGNGNNIRITQSGGVAGTPGSIANLVPPASASYVGGSSTFVWQSNTNIAANMDFGAAILRNLSPDSTFGLTLQPPAGLSSNYSITLPFLPLATSLLQIDTSGTISTVASGTAGQVLTSNGASAPTFQDPAVFMPVAPTTTVLTSTGTATGYLFTVTSANATVGATYVNNGNTFTVLQTISSGTKLFTSGTGALTGSTLTRSSGTGDVTITFSIAQTMATYTAPTGPAPLYLRVRVVGGGGGGGGGSFNASGTDGGTGLSTAFGSGLLLANGGVGGRTSFAGDLSIGGPGGTAIVNSPASQLVAVSGGNGTGGSQDGTSNPVSTAGGSGGASAFGGNGGGGNSTNGGPPGTAATSGQAGTGGGGGGGTAAGSAAQAASAGGGGAGGYAEAFIAPVSSTYFYVVGTGGAAGIGSFGGVGGAAGAGGSGQIIIEAFYQ